MDYYDEEEEQVKSVITHKKNEFRVEIRRKKMHQDLQTKRLKTINQPYNSQHEDNNVSQNQQNNKQYQENQQRQPSQQSMTSENSQNDNNIYSQFQVDQQGIPDILHIEEELDRVMTELQNAHKMKDVLLCQDLMRLLHRWVNYYIQKELVEISQVLNLMIKVNLHLFCAVFTSMKYLQHEDLQLYSYCILAQMTSIINKQNLDEMVDKKLFNHFIETLQHSSSSPKLIDNLFHSMGNLAGDCTFGSFFCSELADRNIVQAVLQLIESSQEDIIDEYIDSLLFFVWNFIRFIPEIQREEVYTLTPMLLILLKILKIETQKKYVIQCLANLILYEPTNISYFSEEDYSNTAWLIYNHPRLVGFSLNFIVNIVNECSDEAIMKLVQNSLLISLVKVVESSQEIHRKKAAFILSNIASIPEQEIQDQILDEKHYKPLMKSLVDESSLKVKTELAYFLINLISSASAETIITLIEKKNVLLFMDMIFSQFQSDIDLMALSIQGFCSLFRQITLFASHQQFRKYMKEIQEIGLFQVIERFTNHGNIEISSRAEGLFNELQEHNLYNSQKEDENVQNEQQNNNNHHSSTIFNSRNDMQVMQFSNSNTQNVFMKHLQNINQFPDQGNSQNNNQNNNYFQQQYSNQKQNQQNNKNLMVSE